MSVCVRVLTRAPPATVRTMTAGQFQRLQQLHEVRQGGSAALPPVSHPPDAPLPGNASMPTLHHFFSTPSSILSPKHQHHHQQPPHRYADASSGNWAPGPPVAPAVPVMEELSGIRFAALPFCEEVSQSGSE